MEKKNYGDKLVILNSPEFMDRLSEIKGADPEISWKDVSSRINDEFDIDISPARVSDIYKRELTREVTISRQARKKLDRFVDSIGDRFGSLEKTSERYHRIISRAMSALEECEDEELLARISDVLKAGKGVETVHKMTMGQIELIRDEQDKITVTQKEGVYTPDQVKSNVYKQLSKTLSMLESQGSIKIMDSNILNT